MKILQNKIVVSVQPFYGNELKAQDTESPSIPWWVWVIGGILVAAILLLIVLHSTFRNVEKRRRTMEILEEQEEFIR